MNRRTFIKNSTLLAAAASLPAGIGLRAATNTPASPALSDNAPDVRVSKINPRYFTLPSANGGEKTFIPNGPNIARPMREHWFDEDAGLGDYRRWFASFAANRCNFTRLWLGNQFFNPEIERAGVFDEGKTKLLRTVLDMAQAHGVRIKLTIEHFRRIAASDSGAELGQNPDFIRSAYHVDSPGGYARNMRDFVENSKCRRQYLKKYDWLAKNFAAHPAIFALEPWNEMNAVDAPLSSAIDWTSQMLAELRKRFPGKLITHNFTSGEGYHMMSNYAEYAKIPGNDFLQIHRYLNPGAQLLICHGAMDAMFVDAAGALRSMTEKRPLPIVVAECGAVKRGHTGHSELYAKDTEGVLLHDMVFAPFFGGAAGSGQAWQWDRYIVPHNLWYHYGRFARAIEGFDPVAEMADPRTEESGPLRAYYLRGKTQTLVWCRDRNGEGRAGLDPIMPPERILKDIKFGLRKYVFNSVRKIPASATWYDPWTDTEAPLEIKHHTIALPPIKRSGVIRLMAA